MLSSGTTWENVKTNSLCTFAILERQLDQVGQAWILFIVAEVKQGCFSNSLDEEFFHMSKYL